MIRGKLNIGDEYFHKGKGRWKRKTARGWVFRSIAVMEEKLGYRIDPKKFHVHHKDRDITNDDPSNLEVKPIGNHISDHRTGHTDQVGEKNNMAKLNEVLVKRVRALAETNQFTQRQIAQMVEISQPRVNRIIKGKAWSHVN